MLELCRRAQSSKPSSDATDVLSLSLVVCYKKNRGSVWVEESGSCHCIGVCMEMEVGFGGVIGWKVRSGFQMFWSEHIKGWQRYNGDGLLNKVLLVAQNEVNKYKNSAVKSLI